MRLLADENIWLRIVQALTEIGHDVVRVSERCPGTKDLDLLALATAEDRVLITRDLDFADLVIRDRRPCAGIILLRFARSEASHVQKALLLLLEEHGERLHREFVVLHPRRRRVVPLP